MYQGDDDKHLVEIQKILQKTLHTVTTSTKMMFEREESLQKTLESAESLALHSKRFKKKTSWETASLFWRTIWFINIFKYCGIGDWY